SASPARMGEGAGIFRLSEGAAKGHLQDRRQRLVAPPGLEPGRPVGLGILSPVRLPVPPRGQPRSCASEIAVVLLAAKSWLSPCFHLRLASRGRRLLASSAPKTVFTIAACKQLLRSRPECRS